MQYFCSIWGFFLAFHSICMPHSECMNKYYLVGTMLQKETYKKRGKKNPAKKPQPFPTAKMPKSPYATCYLILPNRKELREHLGFES